MNNFARDMTPALNLTRERGAGAVRHQRPLYVDLLPPCNAACPAGENIQAWLGLAQAGNYRAAWETLIRTTLCRRCTDVSATTLVKRDAIARSLTAPSAFMPSSGSWATSRWSNAGRYRSDKIAGGKRVLVIGAGPSGLSAAYHLTRIGHEVEIHDAGPLPGGMLHFGIPAYRLPREDLMKEIGRIEQMGVKFVANHRVDDVLAEQQAGGFDAVFIAIGAHLSKHVDIPARDAIKVMDAVSLLRDVEAGTAPRLGDA